MLFKWNSFSFKLSILFSVLLYLARSPMESYVHLTVPWDFQSSFQDNHQYGNFLRDGGCRNIWYMVAADSFCSDEVVGHNSSIPWSLLSPYFKSFLLCTSGDRAELLQSMWTLSEGPQVLMAQLLTRIAHWSLSLFWFKGEPLFHTA